MHFIFFLHRVKEWSWYVCQESVLPCLNWILTPASFCIFFIISPFLPMMMPTANLGTTTWMKGIQKSFFSPFYLFFKKRNHVVSSLLSVIKIKLRGWGCLTSRLFPPIFDPKSALPTLKSPWSLSRISFTTSSRACYRKTKQNQKTQNIFRHNKHGCWNSVHKHRGFSISSGRLKA